MEQTNTTTALYQNFMLAVRREMGWPAFKPSNDCIAFCSGQEMDFAVGAEMVRIATMLGKDGVYTGWKNTTAALPIGFTIIYREMLTVDIIDGVVPYVANDEARLVFVSTRKDETFAVDGRGSLVRMVGRPKAIGKGRARAMKRIRVTAATMDGSLLPGNRFVATWSDWIEPEAPVETVVQFG